MQGGENTYQTNDNDIVVVGENKPNPLYLVDGVEKTGIVNIDPNDIESIEVLKDAKATAKYGEKGKNGVILIQTKRKQ